VSKVQPFHCSTSHRDPFRHGSRMGGGSKGQWLHRLEGGGVALPGVRPSQRSRDSLRSQPTDPSRNSPKGQVSPGLHKDDYKAFVEAVGQ
jgi:hypothetical protein